MNEQTINKGLMIAGGLLGLGILGYLFFREKEEVGEEAEFTIVQEPKPQAQKVTPKTAVVFKEAIPVEKEGKAIVVKQSKSADKAKEAVTIKTEETVVLNDDFPLRLGSKGKRVEQLKVYLLRNHGSAGIVTDDFNITTQERVEKYLKVETITESLFNKLNMDGSKKKENNGAKAKH